MVDFNIDNKIVSINRKNGSKIIEIEGELASENAYSSDIISEVEKKLFPQLKKSILLLEWNWRVHPMKEPLPLIQ